MVPAKYSTCRRQCAGAAALSSGAVPSHQCLQEPKQNCAGAYGHKAAAATSSSHDIKSNTSEHSAIAQYLLLPLLSCHCCSLARQCPSLQRLYTSGTQGLLALRNSFCS